MADLLNCRFRYRYPSGFTLDADLRIPEGAGVTVLFGPSGSGKTSLLRAIAGLESPGSADIQFRGRNWGALPPQQRRAGLLFQDYALFPHLTAAENVGFAASAQRAKEVMDRFGIAAFADQKPRSLSGGQQQRVALARAIAAEPDLLLLDEPLSALDAATRAGLRRQLRATLLTSGIPAIVVTHDRTEAIALGDWMAVMIAGKVRQQGRVSEVFRRPTDREVAASVGVENVIAAKVVGREGGLLTLLAGDALIQTIDSGERGSVLACIHAEDVAIAREASHSSVRNRIPGVVRDTAPEGPLTRVELDCGFSLVALVTAQSAAELGLAPGTQVTAVVKTTSVHLVAQPEDIIG